MSDRGKDLLCTFASALLIALVFSTLSYAVTPDRISGRLTSDQTVALFGNVHHKALPQYDEGPVDPSLRLGSITLLTEPTASQQKALTKLLAQQQDRRSPNYHKWLTPDQWADRFGLSPNDVHQITAWLKSQGFGGLHVARGRNWIRFSGTAAQVQSAFGTEIHRYNVDGELHVANATAPKIPVALAGMVTGLRGLHDFHLQPRGVKRARPYYTSAKFGDLVAPGDVATIYDLNALYNAGIDGTGQTLAVIGQTDIYQADLNGFRTGFGLSSISCTTDSTDVITACSDARFQYAVPTGLTDPATPLTTGDLSEADLDLEWSGAVAPNAQIVYVNAPAVFGTGGSLISGGVWVAWYDAVDNNRAAVITMSYGLCEFGDNGLAADETELQKANSQGITFVNSTGDTGAAECDGNGTPPNGTLTSTGLATQGLAVGYPASSPEVTGVGGTAIPLANLNNPTYWGTSNGTDGGSALSYIPEQAWNDDEEIAQFCVANPTNFCKQGGNTPVTGWVLITNAKTAQQDIGISSTGGGASNCAVENSAFTACVSGFAQPSWQTVTISGQTSARFTPDVSVMASANFPGYIFCTQLSELGTSGTGSSCATGISNSVENHGSIIGGTSASAPIVAGIVALLDQYLGGPSFTGLGNINPMLYSLAATPSNKAFNPVNTADNMVYCQAGTPGSPQPSTLWCPTAGVFGFSALNKDTATNYNLVTGLGSVDANNLALAWAATRRVTAISLATSATQSFQGDNVTLTATVTPSAGATGNVEFDNGSTILGLVAPSAGGTAALTTSSLPVAANSIVAFYNGDSALANSPASNTVAVTVQQAFTLTPSATSVPVTQGSPVDVQVALTITSGFTGTVTFACSDPAPESTCTPPAATGTSGNVTFHITTTAATASLRRPLDHSSRIFYALLLPGLFGILLTAGSHKRSLRGMRMLGLTMVLGVSTMWLGSCGGGSSPTPVHDPGTPKSSYAIKVTGTSGVATGSASFTLVVQ